LYQQESSEIASFMDCFISSFTESEKNRLKIREKEGK